MLSYHVKVAGPLLQNKNNIKDILNTSLRETADWGQNKIRSITPVRTGRLKAGWNVIPTSSYIKIENLVPYAPYVERKRFMAARTIPEIKTKLQQVLSQETDKLKMSLYTKLAEVEEKVAYIEDALGLPQRRYLLVRHQHLNINTRLLQITDTLLIPKAFITTLPRRFVNLQVSIDGVNSINLSTQDLYVEVPRTFPKELFIPGGDTTVIFVLEPPVSNNQVVYLNSTTKTIEGAQNYGMVTLMDDDPTIWKLFLRKKKDDKKVI